MKLYEYNAKLIFKNEGIPIPEGYTARDTSEVKKIFEKMDKPVALKSQVLVGGRGKAGGIKFAEDPQNAVEVAEELLSTEIKGEKVNILLVEEKVSIQKEFYVSVAFDRANKKPLIMASAEGGVEIEELASTNPEKIVKYHINPLDEFLPYEGREIARKMGVGSSLISPVGSIIWKLYQVFQKYDAQLAEINPLIITDKGIIAADAKLELEDDSLYKHKEFMELDEYQEEEFAFVKLEGDIAVIGNGAGLTLTGMDMIKLNGGEPATFLDIGGGASPDIIKKALNLVISYSPVKVIFLNVLGGITRADDVAKGVIKTLEESERKVPLVIRLTGTNEKEGQRLLDAAGISFETSMESAAKKAVQLCNSL
ncbi:ADP-forming succinate--CoA ligase subunit beta [Methanobacterium alcaliphilum]|uniref:ADP-forming succinate--CoA ligase subunit beta n=1 Tax=Methanobacterium alcaliphilum TaxID=392018 RepID=UPI00200B073E|nr:ADP-forming succinate--CoA ligase subunit beta [Methanobacterium alcaliphilum]MCK9150398.1 ADP-forming succinate--CoA ligase subunit beta [Methanobacterium alcaliphilum]